MLKKLLKSQTSEVNNSTYGRPTENFQLDSQLTKIVLQLCISSLCSQSTLNMFSTGSESMLGSPKIPTLRSNISTYGRPTENVRLDSQLNKIVLQLCSPSLYSQSTFCVRRKFGASFHDLFTSQRQKFQKALEAAFLKIEV